MNFNKIFLVALIFGFFLLFSIGSINSAAAANKDIYVAVNGNDTNNLGNSSNSPYATIQKAVDNCGHSDVAIIHLSEGTFSGTGNSLITITKAHRTQHGSITIVGASYNKTVIDGTYNSNIFDIKSDSIVILKNMTFINCKNVNGGVISSIGNLTVINCIFDNNQAVQNGGAIYITSGTCSIYNSTFNNNSASAGDLYSGSNGGVIYFGGYQGSGTLTVDNSIFTNNYVSTSQISGGNGGAIYSPGTSTFTSTITNSVFINNSAISTYHSSYPNPTYVNKGGSVYLSSGYLVNNSFINSSIVGSAPVGSAFYIGTDGTYTAQNNLMINCSINGVFEPDVYTHQANTSTNVTLSPSIGKDGDYVEVTVVVTSQDGSMVNEGFVEFFLSGTSLGTVEVINGKATKSIQVKGPIGPYFISAKYLGTVHFNESGGIGVYQLVMVTVDADHAGGSYNRVQNVTLTSNDPNATIYYTTDGTNPTTNSKVYSGPILINSNITLKYFAVDHAGHQSIIYTQIYVLDTVAPVVSSVDPVRGEVVKVSNKVIKVTFSEAIKADSLMFDLKNNSGTLVQVTYTLTGNVLTITPQNILANGMYTLTLRNGTDLAGNVLALYSTNFTVNAVVPKVINITDANYQNYFNPYTGKILDTANINAGDTLRIGNVSNKLFTIDRPLTLTTIAQGNVIKNGVIHLAEGSSGSSVIGLKIVNDKTDLVIDGIEVTKLHGIWLSHSNNDYIFNNSVQLANDRGVFAMPMGWSSYNTIIYNTLISTQSTCMPMGDSNYNNISYNYLQSTNANVVYYNPWGHADYAGSGICIGNYFSNNYIHTISAGPFAIAMAVNNAITTIGETTSTIYSSVTIVNNIIDNAGFGIQVGGNSIIKNNTIITQSSAIEAVSDNVTVSDNTIYCPGTGIYIGSSGSVVLPAIVSGNKVFNSTGHAAINVDADYCVLMNNTVDTDSVFFGIYIQSNNVTVNGNTVNIRNYGNGIEVAGDNSQIFNNNINVAKNKGIVILASNANIYNNNIKAGIGVVIDSTDIVWNLLPDSSTVASSWKYPSPSNRLYFNIINNNIITSSSYGIFLNGNVYNTTISGNIITSNESMGIVRNTTDYFGDNTSDNTVNGVVTDFTGVIINDMNFYTYFDEDGYFKLKSSTDEYIIILTYLSNKIINVDRNMTFFSNGLANLLTNVTIVVQRGGSGSTVKDLSFFNQNMAAIVLKDGTGSINILNNNITIFSDTNFKNTLTGISIGTCNYTNVESNNIFMMSNNAYIYGISLIGKSNYLNIYNNSIILEGDNLVEGIYCELLGYSNITYNTINLLGNGFGYGFAASNVNGPVHDLNITNNVIVANIGKMLYLIELHITQNMTIINNTLNGKANGVYGVAVYNSNNTIIQSNEIKTVGGNLSKITNNPDVLGTGNAAIYISYNTNNTVAKNNTLYTNAAKQIIIYNSKAGLINSFSGNYFVVCDDNIVNYFDSNYVFDNGLVTQNDTLLFDNIKTYHNLFFNTTLNINSYSKNSIINCTFTFKPGASDSNITNLNFNLVNNIAFLIDNGININFSNNVINILSTNPALNNLSAIVITQYSTYNKIHNNNITMTGKSNLTAITIYNFFDGYYGRSPEFNVIDGNVINLKSNLSVTGIYNAMTGNTTISNNKINLFANDSACGVYNIYLKDFKVFMSTLWTQNTNIINNTISASATQVQLIMSIMANNTFISGNVLRSSSVASYGYVAYNTSGDQFNYNDIEINGTNTNVNFINLDWVKVPQTGVYISSGSSKCTLNENSIVSNYILGNDYAVYIDGNAPNITVKDNYLISDNNQRLANKAIHYGNSTTVNNNGYYYVYVSINGSDVTGDGSKYNPFRTLENAVSKVINKGIVYISSGVYYESSILVNKMVTIVNLGYVNTTTDNDPVNDVLINGGGSQIFNIAKNGKLTVIGLNFTNANANNGAVFYNNGTLSIEDCNFYKNTANNYGGVAVNYGNLQIENSTFSFNTAYRGGVIDNYGNLTIFSSNFFNNSVYMNGSGAVIFAHDKSIINIQKANFTNNSASKANTSPIYQTTDENKIAYGAGGAIYNLGNLYIYDSIFNNNNAITMGGAIVSSSNSGIKDLFITNSNFIHNRAQGGGAITIIQNDKVTILNSLFYKNEGTVQTGGAINIQDSTLTMNNVTMNSNSVAANGGAIASYNTDLTIINSTLNGNMANSGGAIDFSGVNLGGHPSASLTILNSTISNNIGFERGGAFYLNNGAKVYVANSNIFGNWASINPTLYVETGNDPLYADIQMPDNWWGNPYGPDDSVWLAATNFKNWKQQIITWEISGNSSSGSDIGGIPNPWYNPNSGSTNSGSGLGFGTGTGIGLGSGSGIGFGDGSGSGIGGSGSGSGTGGSGSGSGTGGSGSGSGSGGSGTGSGGGGSSPGGSGGNSNIPGGNTNSTVIWNSIGTTGLTAALGYKSVGESGSSGRSGGGGSGSRAYEVNEQKNSQKSNESNILAGLLVVIFFMILVIAGYLINNRKTG